MKVQRIVPYKVDLTLNGKRVLFPVRFSDGSVRNKECDIYVRADEMGVGYADIAYNEPPVTVNGNGISILIQLDETAYKKLRFDSGLVV